MFITQVAADIFGNKLNFELTFSSRPTVSELTRSTEAAFSGEIARVRPDGVPAHTFHVSKIKLYDEDRNKWIDLTSDAQLTDYCQLYAFQPENAWHKETQKAIPPATKPPTGNITTTSSSHSYAATHSPAHRSITASTGALQPYTGSSHAVTAVTTLGGSHHLRGSSDAMSESTALSTRVRPARPASASTSTTIHHAHTTSHNTTTSALVVPRSLAEMGGGAISAAASPEEKLRTVFAEFDTKSLRAVDLDDFRRAFSHLGLDFSSATIDDLFARADVTHDGRLSFAKFERFARLYPIMMDCLFFRIRAAGEEEQVLRELEAEREAVQRAESGLHQTMERLQRVEEEVNSAQAQVRLAEEELRERTGKMRELADEMESARQDRERAVAGRQTREKDVLELRESEKESRRALQDIARESDRLERRAGALASDAGDAEEKVRQLMKALEEAQRAAEKAHEWAEKAAQEAEEAKAREREANRAVEAVMHEALPRAEEALRAAERVALSAEQTLKEMDAVGKELGREADEAARRRDVSERVVVETREKAAQRAREVETARGQLEEREAVERQKEAELEEHRRQRDVVTQHERTLIEQELRLREQRDSLEERETKLLSEASSFLGNMRNVFTGGRPYSRTPSTM